MSQFNAPAAGDTLAPKDLIGQLLIVRPTEHAHGINTVHGEKDGIRADVAVLTQQNADGSYGVVYRQILWLQGKLVGSLKSQIGDLVLARMAIGTGKPGQNPPFELDDATGDAQALAFAEQWMAAHPDFVSALKPPTQAAPAPAAVPAAAPVPVPGAAPAPVAVPAAVPMPVPAAVPAQVPAAVPVAQPVPAAVPVSAAPAAAPLDMSVVDQLTPEARAQLLAALGQTA